jgi:hypothetical protein
VVFKDIYFNRLKTEQVSILFHTLIIAYYRTFYSHTQVSQHVFFFQFTTHEHQLLRQTIQNFTQNVYKENVNEDVI